MKALNLFIIVSFISLSVAAQVKTIVEVADHFQQCSTQVLGQTSPCLILKEGAVITYVDPKNVEGFNYEEGYTYKLKVEKTTNTFSGGLKYKLIKQLDKKKAAPKNSDDIPFTTIEGYFSTINELKDEDLILIKDQKTFDMYFHPATVMGKSTTIIDFEKNLVYAYLSPVTNNEVKLVCERAYIKDKIIQIRYRKTVGPSTSFSIKPVLIVAFPKSYFKNKQAIVYINDKDFLVTSGK